MDLVLDGKIESEDEMRIFWTRTPASIYTDFAHHITVPICTILTKMLALGNIGLLHANIPHARLLDPKACKGDSITPPGVDQRENVSPAKAR